jgi:hypothetical protein
MDNLGDLTFSIEVDFVGRPTATAGLHGHRDQNSCGHRLTQSDKGGATCP